MTVYNLFFFLKQKDEKSQKSLNVFSEQTHFFSNLK